MLLHWLTQQAMVEHQADVAVAAAVTALREAMGGKPPPNYGQAVAEQAKARSPRRNKAKRKG